VKTTALYETIKNVSCILVGLCKKSLFKGEKDLQYSGPIAAPRRPT